MPKKRKPSYLLHKPTGQARVRINGKDHYLGSHGSQESRDRYDDLVAEWFSRNEVGCYSLTIDDLAILYLKYAEQYYRKNGKPTGESKNIKYALRFLVKSAGKSRAREFGALKLVATRQTMIDAGLCRTNINRHVSRIKGMFKWAAANELIPASVCYAVSNVAGLKRGRTDAKESAPVLPVPTDHIDAVRGHVTSPVLGLINLQLFSGARPGEALLIRGTDINMSGRIWEYTPASHKSEHHGRHRVVFIGPRSKHLLRQFLSADLQAYLFSPRNGRAEFESASYTNRGKKRRCKRRCADRRPGEHYTITSYNGAIRKACLRAGVPHWHPNQLRHNAATEIRREFGIEACRVVLGHSTAFTTEIYAERDFEMARDIMAKVG